MSIGRSRRKMMVAEHRALAERGAELVEFRLDWLSGPTDVASLLADRPTPVVMTCRRQADLGRWRGTEEQRQTVLRTAIVSGADYVDLELDIAGKIPRYGKTQRIISHHDFEKTPDDLEEIHERMTGLDPDIIKLVTMANTPSDVVRMLRLVDQAKVPTIGFCMGELGIPSRILCGKYGSPFTYATFSRERELAPGQLSFDDMKRIYGYDRVGPDTSVYGVLGDPVSHSLSPLLHNKAYRKLGVNAVYVPFRVPSDVLTESLEAFDFLKVAGYSVTIPHKEAVLGIAREFVDPVREIGAANTLRRLDSGSWQAGNTDFTAIRDVLQDALGPEDSLAGKKVLILGAGGVARAAGYAVTRAGAALTIANRTVDRARRLAEELNCRFIRWDGRAGEFADILINATSIGMHPNVDETPFDENWMPERLIVFDTVYTPENTLLLKSARERGCQTVSGLEMFVRQAAEQFEVFTNRPAPVEYLRDTLRRGISPLRQDDD